MSRSKKLAATAVAAALFGQACVNAGSPMPPSGGPHGAAGAGGPTASAQQKQLATAPAQKPLAATETQKQTDSAIERWFNTYPTRRAYLQLDKPIYQPG